MYAHRLLDYLYYVDIFIVQWYIPYFSYHPRHKLSFLISFIIAILSVELTYNHVMIMARDILFGANYVASHQSFFLHLMIMARDILFVAIYVASYQSFFLHLKDGAPDFIIALVI